jgi:hypothetical protein
LERRPGFRGGRFFYLLHSFFYRRADLPPRFFAGPTLVAPAFADLRFLGRFVICLFQLPGGAFCAGSMGGAWTSSFLVTVRRSFG